MGMNVVIEARGSVGKRQGTRAMASQQHGTVQSW